LIKCTDCGHKLYKETAYTSWLSLFNFIEFLASEENISAETYSSMIDRLMDLKQFVVEND
jgi:predicted nucleic-acid-binding protein